MRVGGKEVKRVLATRKNVRIPADAKKAQKLAKKFLKDLGKKVSKHLGNTPDVALTGYTNPALCEHLLERIGFKPGMFPTIEKSYRLTGYEEDWNVVRDKVETSDRLPLLRALLGDDTLDTWKQVGFQRIYLPMWAEPWDSQRAEATFKALADYS